jgi:hypothetical protein
MGTIPTELAYDAQRPIAPLRITQQNEQPAIAFRPGWPIYLEHWIYVDGDRPLVVDATIASPDASLDSPSLLTATRCNKDLLQSYECVTDQIRLTSSQEQQIRFELPRIPSDRLENRWRSLRPQAISLSVGGKNVVTFANLSISNLQAEEVSAIPSDRPTGIEGAWIFTCDDHLAWRTKNAWVHMLFEHGLLGLIAAAWIQVVLIRRLLVAKQCAGIERPIVATALGGFAFIALFGTLVDTPWLCALMLSVGSLVCIDERTEHADLIVETS